VNNWVSLGGGVENKNHMPSVFVLGAGCFPTAQQGENPMPIGLVGFRKES